METCFEVKDLNLYYGENQALKHLNLTIGRNRVMALIGPSGCGKSTFLRCLNRMNDLIENCRITGEIHLLEQNIYDQKMNVVQLRTKVGMVFQKPNPFPMSIYDNIAYGPRCQGVKEKKLLNQIVERSLKSAALYEEVKDRLHDSAMALSGGQQQRVAIARALAAKPAILLADEPTGNLDSRTSQDVMGLLKTTSTKFAQTIVMITHNEEIAQLADRIIRIEDGRIVTGKAGEAL